MFEARGCHFDSWRIFTILEQRAASETTARLRVGSFKYARSMDNVETVTDVR